MSQTTTVTYLEIHLDSQLTWKQHVRGKIDQIRNRKEEYVLAYQSKRGKLSTDNQLLVYGTIVKLIWTYDIDPRNTAAESHIAKLGALRSIMSRTIVNATRYV